MAPISPPTHEWVSFPDPDEERTWMFDVTFLLSNWTCIFGRGCKGVLTEPAPEMVQGCCSYGAHFVDADDVERVEKAATTLTPDQWQFARQGRRGVTRRTRGGDVLTRQVDDACIFLNRPDFAGGAGCALHRAALETGQRPMDLKPDVCWQLPLRREDHQEATGHVVTTVGQWERRHWGGGGDEFAWWCTESGDAFVGGRPVYREMADELEAMVNPEVMASLRRYLADRESRGTPLPHPAVRTRRRAAR